MKRRRRGGMGNRGSEDGRELVSKPAISFKKSWGGHSRTTRCTGYLHAQSLLGWAKIVLHLLAVKCSNTIFFFFFFAHFHFPASGQAVVTGVIPSPPRFLPSIFFAHRVQQSHCPSIVHRMLLTHALALSASQFVHKKKSQRIYTIMHSAGLELTKLTYTRLDDNLIRHRGDR